MNLSVRHPSVRVREQSRETVRGSARRGIMSQSIRQEASNVSWPGRLLGRPSSLLPLAPKTYSRSKTAAGSKQKPSGQAGLEAESSKCAPCDAIRLPASRSIRRGLRGRRRVAAAFGWLPAGPNLGKATHRRPPAAARRSGRGKSCCRDERESGSAARSESNGITPLFLHPSRPRKTFSCGFRLSLDRPAGRRDGSRRTPEDKT
jgi:hypothetical protein